MVGAALRRFLFGVDASDLTTLLSAPAVLMTTALIATLLPARRATRVDPAQVLRAE